MFTSNQRKKEVVNTADHVVTMVEAKVDTEVVETKVVTEVAVEKVMVVEEPQGENNER
jgi:hypothetical protein